MWLVPSLGPLLPSPPDAVTDRAFKNLRYPAARETKGEAAMFEMLNEEKPDADSRKLFWMKVGIFVAAVAAMGGVIYLSFYLTT